ncbi:MAG: hypothetical protein AAGK02_04660 [Pseudomonadota bacterium]
MTDDIVAQARRELRLMDAAFSELRDRHINEILRATNADDAFQGVLAVRALDSVVKSLEAPIETHRIQRKLEEDDG